LGEPGEELDLAITLRRGVDAHSAFTATLQGGERRVRSGPWSSLRSGIRSAACA
jgi:hypothetical protein